MADLTTDFCGVTSPNPFWLASAPTDQHRIPNQQSVRVRLGRRGLENRRHARLKRFVALRRLGI